MNLEQCLTDIASTFGFDAQALVAYAYEDKETGWDLGQGDWPVGSLWMVEGKVLYALTRALKPRYVLEIGTFYGCSSTHILRAIVANGTGRLICVDRNAHGVKVASLVPDDLRPHMEFVQADAVEWIRDAMLDDGFDLVFEDADHSVEVTRDVWAGASAKLSGGGVIVSHDAMHFLVGRDVRQGILDSGVEGARFYKIEPSDCGLAIFRKPEEVKPVYKAMVDEWAKQYVESKAVVKSKPTKKRSKK